MGADQSKLQYGNLFIQTDKSTYFGGDTVTGKVYLNLLMPYPGNQLNLKLKGKEYAAFLQTESKSQQVTENGMTVTKQVDVDVPYEDKRDIIKLLVPMYSWAVLMPGQYTIPFSFMLPQDLPSSFHQEASKLVGDISYWLEARLEPAMKGSAKLKYKQAFVVRQPIKSAMQGVGNEKTTNLTACCSGKGTNTLKAKFEKNFYAPGETAQVNMQLDNTQSQLSNTGINFSLKQKLTLNVKGKEKEENFTKVQRNLPGIPAGGASDSSFISINLPSFQVQEWTITKATNLIDYLKSLKGNNEILNSATKGKFIKSEYYLEVACPMDGCCAPSPSISCPIEIYYPEITLFQPPIPTGWAPQEISMVNLSFNGPQVQMGAGNMSVSVNMDPVNMAAGTMMAAGNIMTNQAAMMGGNMNMTVTTNTQQSGGFQPNGGFQTQSSGGFQPNGGQQDGFHINMTTTETHTHHQEYNNGNMHVEYKF